MIRSLFDYFAQIKITPDEIKLPTVSANGAVLNNIIGLVYVALGAVCVFFIVRGALLYVTSGSDPSSNKQARETIIYAVVALAASTLVFVFINFIVNSVGGTR